VMHYTMATLSGKNSLEKNCRGHGRGGFELLALQI
jgi:hypothetical protein